MASRTQHRQPGLQARPRTNPATTSDENESRFLSLPGEIRNMIYKYAAHSTNRITLHDFDDDGCKMVSHPLSQVCRQVRQEFTPLWKHEASKHAKDVDVHLRNFDFKHVEKAMESLARQASGVKRQYHVKICLDDTFTSKANQNHFFALLHGRLRRVLTRQGPVESIGFWVDFNRKNFNADYAKAWFQKEVKQEWNDEGHIANANEFGHFMLVRAVKRALRRAERRARAKGHGREDWREAVLRKSVELK